MMFSTWGIVAIPVISMARVGCQPLKKAKLSKPPQRQSNRTQRTRLDFGLIYLFSLVIFQP